MLVKVIVRALLAVLIGGLIGSERARHGRAAGMRTHILVCLGAALTSMTSVYVSQMLSMNGDVFRIPAQVISGVGFLGAGMIILKSNNTITGLTTAAGVWTTGAIGVAVGYGFYEGAAVVTVLFLVAIVLFAKFEQRRKAVEVVYLELDDMSRTNAILKQLESVMPEPFTARVIAPKSACEGHVGLMIVTEKRVELDLSTLTQIDHVLLAVED